MKGDRKQQALDTAKTCKTAVYNLYNHKLLHSATRRYITQRLKCVYVHQAEQVS